MHSLPLPISLCSRRQDYTISRYHINTNLINKWWVNPPPYACVQITRAADIRYCTCTVFKYECIYVNEWMNVCVCSYLDGLLCSSMASLSLLLCRGCPIPSLFSMSLLVSASIACPDVTCCLMVLIYWGIPVKETVW